MWWLNEYEEKIIGPFYDFVLSNTKRLFVFELNDGAIVKVRFDTEGESDNNLDLNEDGYEEFREAYFEILDIIKDDTNSYTVGQLIAINYHCVPNSYKLVD